MLLLFLFISILILLIFYPKQTKQKDNLFYNILDINDNITCIEKYKNKILDETINVNNNMKAEWKDWVESKLYTKNNEKSWKIYPFYAFGVWAKENCIKCPNITQFLLSIKGLKLATLSKLSAGIKLKYHMGWGFHSNNVIRCHYGIIVPKLCYISVTNNIIPPLYDNDNIKINSFPNNIYKLGEEIVFHKQFEWLIFDDSKTHYAENMSNEDRIVLIIDVERPKHIKKGISKIGDTKELMELVNYYIKN